MKIKELEFDLIVGDKFPTQFLQAFDLFEKTKITGEVLSLTVNFKENENITKTKIEKIISKIKDTIEKEEKLVAFIGCKLNKLYWENPDIKTISNGTHWFCINDFKNKNKYK